MFTVKILWGSEDVRRNDYDDESVNPSEYSFNTQAEKDAFLMGVDEASGWFDYEIVED